MRLIIHNAALDVIRQRVENEVLPPQTEQDQTHNVDTEIIRQCVVSAIQNMTEDQLSSLVTMALEFGRPS